jgi:hypothetical protein
VQRTARRTVCIMFVPRCARWFSALLPASHRKNFAFLSVVKVQPKQMRRFIELSAMKVDRLSLVVILLFFLSGSFANAGPVGDFFKKVGQSISKPLQPQPQPQPQSTRPPPPKTAHPTRRSTSRAAPAAATAAPAEAQPSHATKEGASTGAVRNLSPADIQKLKADLPYAVPVPGRKGMVTSPYLPEDGKYIDVTAFPSGSVVKDPYTGKFFLVP